MQQTQMCKNVHVIPTSLQTSASNVSKMVDL